MPAGHGRLATALRRLRWPVVIFWVAVVVILNPFASGLSNVTDNGTAAYLPASASSTRVAALRQQAQHSSADVDQAIVVFASGNRLTAGDLAAVASARTAVARLAARAGGLDPPSAPQRSADGQADEFSAGITSQPSSEAVADASAVQAIRQAAGQAASRAGGGLQVAVTGPAAVTADSGTADETLLLVRALLIVAVILLLVYRSPVLWLLPLLGAAGASVIAKAATHALASAGLTVSTLSAAILTGLVLGAGTDYALLLIHRYRQELQRHAACEEAMAAALRRTVPTLLASAATVTISMLCLLAAQSAALHGLGPVGAVSIVSALLAEITFLPAILLIIGRKALWPQIPRNSDPGREESRTWSRIGTRVARHPARVTVVTVLLLGAACAGLATLYANGDHVASVKGSPGSVTGEELLAGHYPAGAFDPVVVLAPPDQAGTASSEARATPGVAVVSPGMPTEGYDSFTVILSAPPYGAQGATTIKDLRQRLNRAAPGSLVGGDPAVQYDIAQAARRDELVLIPLVLAVILLIVALLLRAIVAPVMLLAATALSFGAALGLSSLLWRYGLGYKGTGTQLPLYIFTFLVALGVDYNIFLIARIREESTRLGLRRGTLRGLSVTGGVITSAGIIMAGCFAALTLLPSVEVTEVATAIATGILLDTLLVRTVLVPASLLTVGERAWWPSRSAPGTASARPSRPPGSPAPSTPPQDSPQAQHP
jgi:RND superfamily putative drug exporter